MDDIKKMLEIRSKVKRRKPNYLRQDAHKLKKLGKKWVRPKGIHSKMRRRLRSYRRNPEIGYGSPRKIRHFTKEGLMPVLINSMKDIENLGKDVSIIISSRVGLKSKLGIANKIKEKKLDVENLDVDKFLEDYEKKMKNKKATNMKAKEEPKKSDMTEKKDHGENMPDKDKEKDVKRKVLEKRN